MANVATLAIKVTTDASAAAADLDSVGKKAGGFQGGLDKASVAAAGAGVALVAFGKSALDAASQAQQAQGAVDAVYGSSADTIHNFAKTAATDVGLASSQYEDMAATFGAQLKNMGVAAGDLAPQTDELIGLGADLAAQYGGDTASAVEALGSLMRGETDPIEKYGVSIKAADVAAKKAEMGLAGLTGEADKQATTQATLALLTEQTADATGAFAREADTAAGSTQRANAQWKDTQAKLGAVLLPIVAKAGELFGKLATFVSDNATAFQTLAGVIGAVAAVILTIKAATMAWQAAQMIAKAATTAWTAVQWLLNAAMTANPIGIVVVALGALVAAIIVVVKNWDTIVAAFQTAFDWVKTNWPTLIAILTGPFGVAVLLIVKNWDKVKEVAEAVFDAIKSAIDKAIGWIGNIVGEITGPFVGAWNTLKALAKSALDALLAPIQSVIDKATALYNFVSGTLAGVWDTMKSAASTALGAIISPIQSVIDKARDLSSFVSGTLEGVWSGVKSAAKSAFDAMLAPINAVKSALQGIIDVVNSVIGAISRIHMPSLPSLPDWANPFMAPAPAPARFAAPMVGVGAHGMSTTSSSGSGITINVTGALDPDAVARQIERVLRSRSRRVGGVGMAAAGIRS